MKKKIICAVIAIAVVVLTVLLSDNSAYSLDLDSSQITRITLFQNGTTVDVVSKDDISEIVTNFNSLQLKADKQVSVGYLLKVTFYSGEDVVGDFTVNSATRIYGREVVSGTIDLQLLTSIFKKHN